MDKSFSKYGFGPADILIPDTSAISMESWSVIACDQYTSEPEYWERVSKRVGERASTLHITLPEIYLESGDTDSRIRQINSRMDEYLGAGLFKEYGDSLVYVERTLMSGKLRRGLVGAIDLECYDYEPGSASLIRATEGTVVSRIPPRLKVRENAALELPHVMLLVDDPENLIFSGLRGEREGLLYDFELMEGGGSIKGWLMSQEQRARLAGALEKLSQPKAFNEKYGLSGVKPLLFSVGDGNHSLATAKAHWEKLKASGADPEGHPGRYALTELVNIHDSSLDFEPIHRLVFGVDPAAMLARLEAEGGKAEQGFEIKGVAGGKAAKIKIAAYNSSIAVGALQSFIDAYIAENGGTVDYVHGDEVVLELSKRPDCLGFLVPTLAKSELFRTVILDGVLPRKTFSMGHADDKRFYLEARKIR